MRIARNPGADALQKTVVSKLPARDGLIVSIHGGSAMQVQQCLHERIDERKQSLLPELYPRGFRVTNSRDWQQGDPP